MLGLSQLSVATAAHTSRPVYGRIERGTQRHAPLVATAQIAAVLGLELSARVYPSGPPTRDHAHSERLQRFLGRVGPPLRYRIEVPLPTVPEHSERRAWDAIVLGHGERTAVELEMRLHDVQAQFRRIALKRRDDHPEHFLLVVADTRANRRVLDDVADLLPELPRLRTASVLGTLAAGRHPPTGLILL